MPPQQSLGLPQPSLTLHGSCGLISAVNYVDNGSLRGHLISGSLQTTVYIWDLARTKRLITTFSCDAKSEKNSTVLWTHTTERYPDDLFVQVRDGIFHRWSVHGDKPRRLSSTTTGNQLSFCPGISFDNENFICLPAGEVSSNTSGVGLISQNDCSPVGLFLPEQNFGSPMRMVQVHDHQTLIAYESADLLLWDIRRPSKAIFKSDIIKATQNKDQEDDVTPLALHFDNGRNIVAVGSAGTAVKRFQLGTADLCSTQSSEPVEFDDTVEMSPLASVQLAEPGVTDLKIRKDGKIFTVACWDYTARIFSAKTLKPLAVLDLHRDTVQTVTYAEVNGENCVILGGKDAMISVWPLY